MDITNNDIADVVRIIDACSARGAFRGEELQSVGALRNKFVSYLQLVNDAESKASEDTAEAIN